MDDTFVLVRDVAAVGVYPGLQATQKTAILVGSTDVDFVEWEASRAPALMLATPNAQLVGNVNEIDGILKLAAVGDVQNTAWPPM